MSWLKPVLQAIALTVLMVYAAGAAYFSISGMALLFPAAGIIIAFMAMAMQSAKFVVAWWLASRWPEIFWLLRLLLIGFVLDLTSINAVALHCQLVAAYAAHHDDVVVAIATAPIRSTAEWFSADGEAVIRRLIAAMVVCCDLCGVVITAAFAARLRRAS